MPIFSIRAVAQTGQINFALQPIVKNHPCRQALYGNELLHPRQIIGSACHVPDSSMQSYCADTRELTLGKAQTRTRFGNIASLIRAAVGSNNRLQHHRITYPPSANTPQPHSASLPSSVHVSTSDRVHELY